MRFCSSWWMLRNKLKDHIKNTSTHTYTHFIEICQHLSGPELYSVWLWALVCTHFGCFQGMFLKDQGCHRSAAKQANPAPTTVDFSLYYRVEFWTFLKYDIFGKF